jgi:hypothetical protein
LCICCGSLSFRQFGFGVGDSGCSGGCFGFGGG